MQLAPRCKVDQLQSLFLSLFLSLYPVLFFFLCFCLFIYLTPLLSRRREEEERETRRRRRSGRSEVPRVRGGSDRSFTRDGRVKTCRSTFYTLLSPVCTLCSHRIYGVYPTGEERDVCVCARERLGTAERKRRKTDACRARRPVGLSSPRSGFRVHFDKSFRSSYNVARPRSLSSALSPSLSSSAMLSGLS